jgi:hypothetical protein
MKWSDPKSRAPDRVKLCARYNAVKIRQPNVAASKRYLPLFQDGRTARDWKLKETRHIIPEWKWALPKRLPVQFHTHFPSDANRTMLLDLVAADDDADTWYSHPHAMSEMSAVLPKCNIHDFLFLAIRHIIFRKVSVASSVLIASISHCKNLLCTFLH